MLFLIIVKATIIAPAIAVSETDWCSIASCAPGQHTMCMYKSSTNANGCEDVQDIQTVEERKRILDLHNAYRSKLAGGVTQGWPQASNMREMEYDMTLEEIALRWALQCTPGHDKCRSTADFNFVGQNYHMMGQTMPLDPADSTEKGFQSWVDEISLAPTSLANAYSHSAAYGHFTQAIWAESFKLGCAKISYKKEAWYNNVLICNYGPGGNMIGAPLYSQGQPCSKCATGYSCDKSSPYPNLCQSGNKTSSFERSKGPQHSALKCLVLTLLALTFQHQA